MAETNEKIKSEVKELRTRLGMSQSQFASYFHLNISTLQMWEQGVNHTPPMTVYLLNRVVELETKLGILGEGVVTKSN